MMNSIRRIFAVYFAIAASLAGIYVLGSISIAVIGIGSLNFITGFLQMVLVPAFYILCSFLLLTYLYFAFQLFIYGFKGVIGQEFVVHVMIICCLAGFVCQVIG